MTKNGLMSGIIAQLKSFASTKAVALLCLVMLNVVGAKAQTKTPYAIWCESNGTLYFTNSTRTYSEGGTYDSKKITKVWSGDEVTNYGNSPLWTAEISDNCTGVEFDSSFQEVKLKSVRNWFSGFENPELQIRGLNYLNTSVATDMSYMFDQVLGPETLDLSSFNTNRVENMEGMFMGCTNLKTIYLSNFNTQNVTNMANMFLNCKALTDLNLNNFNTRQVTDMSMMFLGCEKLTNLEVGSFNTENVTNMSNMFLGCVELATIDLSSFNTEKVTNMESMFQGCIKLKTIDLSGFNTENVTNMEAMFYYCTELTTLDLSNFKTVKTENLRSVFGNCNNLKTIYCNNDWSNDAVQVEADMFVNCSNLVGGNGTPFSEDHIGLLYARPDGLAPGYFTLSGESFEYTISDAMVATLYLDFSVNIPSNEDYFDAFTVSSISETGTIHLKKVKNVIPANTGVVIFGNEGTYNLTKYKGNVADITDNMLKGVLEDTSVDDLKGENGTDIYLLSRGKNTYVNFLKAGSGVKTIPANRAYLPYSNASGAKELSIAFDEATGIDNVTTEKAERTGVYNMAGQRVAKPQHGIYIVNGKKVVMK